ncbi:hypothetical protein AMTR_s00145p00024740 [Amborella trichopoda]|uniref:Uncharacterized protein n=1 Tax=Amborella trichopoda TaxID=13333 RepID=W1PFT3_AMBTC|nr:hypothetical protein AMTR_s00145p00024740 [Amborella trichopoda]
MDWLDCALPLGPDKRTKMRASPSPIHPSEAATPSIKETVPIVVVTRPHLSGQTSFRSSCQADSTPPPVVDAKASLAKRPIEPEIVQPPNLSPLGQGDLFWTINEEGDILEARSEIMDEAPVVMT